MGYIYFGFVVTHASVIQKREMDKVSQFKKIKVQRRTVKKTTVLRETSTSLEYIWKHGPVV